MTIQPITQASDKQLRQLTRPWQFAAEYKGMIQSQLPLLTTERSTLVNLLKANDVHSFVASQFFS